MAEIVAQDTNKSPRLLLTDTSGRLTLDSALGSAGAVKVTDGARILTTDLSGRVICGVTNLKPDGTNTMPAMDAVGRAGFVKLTDGTETATVTTDGYLDVKAHTPEKCFAADYTNAQAAQVILTPTGGKKIKVAQAFVSTKTNTTDVTLSFTTSGNVFFKLYTALTGSAAGNFVCAEGAADETITLTCGAGTFVSIGYDEV